jgi:N-acyl-D-amino-acid deacylase
MRHLLTLILLIGSIAAGPALGQPADDASPTRFDLLIRGARVLNGANRPPVLSDVGIRDGRIAAIGELSAARARRVIEAKGLLVAPGFIDVHTHADKAALAHPEAANFLRMGVTTIITGNCGGSVLDLRKHFAAVEKNGISVNYASLIGHGTVRRKVMGREDRAPTEEELGRMKALVKKAMEAGAVGLSTGLIYVPGTFAGTDELVELCRVVAAHGGIYATHMRNESTGILASIDEAVCIGHRSGCAVQISHLKACGKPAWGLAPKIVARLRKARAGGVKVTADQYAYTATSTSLDVLFPASARAVGRKRFGRKLRDDPAFRDRMRAALFKTMQRSGTEDLAYCQIARAPGNSKLNGLTLKEAAKVEWDRDGAEDQARLAIKLMIDADGKRVGMVYHKMCEDDVETIMRAPEVCVASDSGIRNPRSAARPHPRGTGNNARVLGLYVRERKVLDLSLAVYKMTSLPARIFGLNDRGVVRKGAFADLTIFDPKTVRDRATYKEPLQDPDGIPFVIVNGVVVIDRGKHTGKRPGRVLRHVRT